MARSHPPARRHGSLRQVFDDIYFVQGSIGMPGPLPVAFSRNMTVVVDGDTVSLINSMRLDEAGLAALEELGTVKHVLRIAGYHGMDDPFYKERYGATVWSVAGARYSPGFAGNTSKKPPYFEPDEELGDGDETPITGSRFFRIPGITPEGMVLMDRHDGVLVTGDAMQNWDHADEYFNFLGTVMMRMMGFIKPHNVGPGWLRGAKPDRQQLAAVLDLEFEHVLPAHGSTVVGDAKAKYRPAIERVTSRG